MATCPRCKEFLDEDHVCPALWGRTLRWGLTLAAGMALGALVGVIIFGFIGSTLRLTGFEAFGGIFGMLTVFVLMRSIRQW